MGRFISVRRRGVQTVLAAGEYLSQDLEPFSRVIQAEKEGRTLRQRAS